MSRVILVVLFICCSVFSIVDLCEYRECWSEFSEVENSGVNDIVSLIDIVVCMMISIYYMVCLLIVE